MVPNLVIVFDLNGERHRLNFRRVSFNAWSELKRELGFTPKTIIDAVGDFDVEAIGAVIWLDRRQHDRKVQWGTVRQELERADPEPEFALVDFIGDGESLLGESLETPAEEEDPTTAGS